MIFVPRLFSTRDEADVMHLNNLPTSETWHSNAYLLASTADIIATTNMANNKASAAEASAAFDSKARRRPFQHITCLLFNGFHV